MNSQDKRLSNRSFRLHGVRCLQADGSFSEPTDVTVEDGSISAMAPAAKAAREFIAFDAAGLWLLPGVVDCHTHLGMFSTDMLENLSTPFSLRVLHGARNLKRTLQAGVTLARDAGGLDRGFRQALAAGLVEGPRLKLSVVGLSQTGGHFDGFLTGSGTEVSTEYFMPDYPGRPPYLVNGVEEMRRAVRELLRAGADWIKLATTGGVFAGQAALAAAQLSFEEVQVAVTEAAKCGKGVMVHALAGQGIDIAIAAGARSIEHGLYLTEEQAVAMAAHDCALVPTLDVYASIATQARERPESLPDDVRGTAASLEKRFSDTIAVAREAGVRIALGSDCAGADRHGRNLREIAHLHRAGLSVEQSLLAATANGAELLGEGGTRGRIAPGYRFDAILIDEDPGDLSLFERDDAVSGVFIGGASVVDHPQLSAQISGERYQ